MVHHLPRHRYAGLFRSGTFLPHPERGQAIILTGAQQPISNEITDARKTFATASSAPSTPGSRGVMVVFGGHVIAGTRAKKNKTISYDAFASVNFPALALVQGDRLVRYVPSPWPTGLWSLAARSAPASFCSS